MAKLRPVRKDRILGVDLAESQLALIMQLVAIRKARGLTQVEVARRMGMPDHTAVSKFENSINSDKQPTLNTIKRYAEAVEAYTVNFVVDGSIGPNGERAYEDVRQALLDNLKKISQSAPILPEGCSHVIFNAVEEATAYFTASLTYASPKSKSVKSSVVRKKSAKPRVSNQTFLVSASGSAKYVDEQDLVTEAWGPAPDLAEKARSRGEVCTP